MISTTAHLLYSAAAVRRIFSLARNAVVRVEEWASVVWVWIKGQRPRFVSKRVFKAHFVEWRKAQAQKLQVTPHLLSRNWYGIRNPEKGTVYHVDLNGLPVCECEDYKNQNILLGKACCKHIYAALSFCGYQSLKSYLSR